MNKDNRLDPKGFGSASTARFTTGQDTTDQAPDADPFAKPMPGDGETYGPKFGEYSPGTASPSDHFAAAAENAAKEQAEAKGEKFDLEKFRADLRLFLFQHYMNNAVGDFTKNRRTTIEDAVKVAADTLDVPTFTSKAPTIDGDEVEIGKVNVNRTKPSTSITHPNDFRDWAKEYAPDLTTTRTIMNPHLSPEDEAKAWAILRKHMPEAVQDVVELKKNAGDLLSDKTVVKGNKIVLPAHDAVDDETGEVTEVPEQVIPGLHYDKGGKFKNITILAGPTKDKYQQRVMDLLVRNQFKGVTTNTIVQSAQKQIEKK